MFFLSDQFSTSPVDAIPCADPTQTDHLVPKDRQGRPVRQPSPDLNVHVPVPAAAAGCDRSQSVPGSQPGDIQLTACRTLSCQGLSRSDGNVYVTMPKQSSLMERSLTGLSTVV